MADDPQPDTPIGAPEVPSPHFGFDQSTVRPEDSAQMNSFFNQLNTWTQSGVLPQDATLLIVGHTDRKGHVSYNQNLGEQRADAVAGIARPILGSAMKVKTVSAGEGSVTTSAGTMGPRVATPDGVRNPENRFVEMRVLDKDGKPIDLSHLSQPAAPTPDIVVTAPTIPITSFMDQHQITNLSHTLLSVMRDSVGQTQPDLHIASENEAKGKPVDPRVNAERLDAIRRYARHMGYTGKIVIDDPSAPKPDGQLVDQRHVKGSTIGGPAGSDPRSDTFVVSAYSSSAAYTPPHDALSQFMSNGDRNKLDRMVLDARHDAFGKDTPAVNINIQDYIQGQPPERVAAAEQAIRDHLQGDLRFTGPINFTSADPTADPSLKGDHRLAVDGVKGDFSTSRPDHYQGRRGFGMPGSGLTNLRTETASTATTGGTPAPASPTPAPAAAATIAPPRTPVRLASAAAP